MMKFHLHVALFVVVTLSVKNSTLNLYSDEELMTQCTAHASGYVETMVEAGETNFNSKAYGAVVKCHPNQMSISLPKSLLAGINREDLGLLDCNCEATDNNTHFVLSTPLIGCGTFSRHSDTSVVYSNMVRNVLQPTAVITRSPEIKINFSCHYPNDGVVSTGAVTKQKTHDTNEAAGQTFAAEDDFCWNDRFVLFTRNPTCPVHPTNHTPKQVHQKGHIIRGKQ